MNRKSYFTLELNSENMIRINYIQNFKKKVRYYYIKIIKQIKKEIKFILKIFFKNLFKLIKLMTPYKLIWNYAPYSIKLHARHKLLNYSTFFYFIKKIIYLLNEKEKNEKFYTLLYLKLFVKKILSWLSNLIVKNSYCRKILYTEISKYQEIEININPFTRNIQPNCKLTHIKQKNIFLADELNLSNDAYLIYKKIKLILSKDNITL